MKYKPVCPKCRSSRVKSIIYGLPDLSQIQEDDIRGGCCVDDESPKYHCRDCGHEWGTRRGNGV